MLWLIISYSIVYNMTAAAEKARNYEVESQTGGGSLPYDYI